MQIQILDSWIREHVKTKATVKQIAEFMTLKSASIERIKPVGSDFLYDIEVTTNRVDMMSVTGLAREAAVALASEGIPAEFVSQKIPSVKVDTKTFPISIKNDPKLCNRICAVILSVEIGKSPQIIKDRLEAADIRSINNVIDVTNYVMREIGHPMHAFDADKVEDEMVIREAKTGEKIVTLDKKEHTLLGGEIIAEDKNGKIIDLLGIMGLENSSITDATKRVLLFIDNNNSKKIRDASMNLSIRTDAAVLNEKDVDPELAITALYRGIQLLQETANGKLESDVFDVYPNKIKPKTITVSLSKIQQVCGVEISKNQTEDILKGLGFEIKVVKDEFTVTPPTYRAHEIEIPEDVIEEVARMYGYHKIPSKLPALSTAAYTNFQTDIFYWENRVKDTLKYWGFTEVYTYSLIPEDMLEIDPKDAVTLLNPLSTDMTHLRTALVPSLLQTIRENKNFEKIMIFELANVYHKKASDLPSETLMLAGVIKKPNVTFYEVKGILEQLYTDLGIKKYSFKKRKEGAGADLFIGKEKIGEIELLDSSVIDFEINFAEFIKHATLKKTYVPPAKFPEAREDMRFVFKDEIEFEKIVSLIKSVSDLVSNIELLDTYENKKTFRIIYLSHERNLTNKDIQYIREKIISVLETTLEAKIV